MAAEDIERARQREYDAQRARESYAEVVVNTIDDIKRVLVDFAPQARCNTHQPTVGLVTRLEGRDEHDHPALFQVTADTQSKSRRDLLLDGFTVIRDRRNALASARMASKMPLEVNGRDMAPAMPLAEDMVHNVDSMVKSWLGGTRSGEYVIWHLPNGTTYQYDIFAHKVFEIA